MKYNDLLNELFDLLDKNKDIIKLREIKPKLLTNSKLLADIETYQVTKSIALKKKLYTYPEYLEYLHLENNLNFLILEIKNRQSIAKNKKLSYNT